MVKTSASAPGKLILNGEHAVVYGQPAIIGAISLETHCEVRPSKTPGLRIASSVPQTASPSELLVKTLASTLNSADAVVQHPVQSAKVTAVTALEKLKSKARYTIHELSDFYKQAKDKYDAFTLDNDRRHLEFASSDWFAYVKLAVLETAVELELDEKLGLDLHLDSQIPTGGFGSSSAVIVSVVRALAAHAGKQLRPERVYEIALRVETLLRGRASGGDEATATYSGLIRYQRDPQTQARQIRQLELPTGSQALLSCVVIDSGRPTYTTGQVVAWVREQLQSARKLEVEAIIGRLGELTGELESSLQASDNHTFRPAVAEAGELLEKLGIVSSQTRSFLRKLETLYPQAAFKLSGAGTIGLGAGSETGGSGAVLAFVDSDETDSLLSNLTGLGLNHYQVQLGGNLVI